MESRFTPEEALAQLEKTWREIGRLDADWHLVVRPEIAVLEPPDTPHALKFRELRPDVSSDQQTLLVEVMRATTVVQIVIDRRRQRSSLGRRVLEIIFPKNVNEAAHRELNELEGSYLRELKDIADTAISPRGLLYAQQRLNAFKDAFVSREADAVKNHHIKRLAKWAASYAAILLILFITYFYIPQNIRAAISDNDHVIRSFLLLTAASCGGTWISFSLRKVVLRFADLAVLEEDHLAPAARLAFVIILTALFGMMIHNGMISVGFGNKYFVIGAANSMTILLGAFCGIAERSLSGVLARQADESVSSPFLAKERGTGGQK